MIYLKQNKIKGVEFMYRFLWIITWLFIHILYPTKVVGRKNIVKGGAILICNHLSNVDPILIISYNKRKINSIGKKELFNTKLKAWFFRTAGVISVDRGRPDVTAIKSSLKVLSNGGLLSMFPEGTRNKNNEDLQEIKKGCCMLAIKAKVPIIPINIQKKAKIFRRNKIIIGKAFELREFYGQKISNQILDDAGKIVQRKLKELYAINCDIKK